jgi:2-dehydro-3-deoxygluconokinase
LTKNAKPPLTVAAVGEGMIELTAADNDDDKSIDALKVGFGGDVVNTAIYLARLGAKARFFTAVGKDPLSRQMRRAWQKHFVDDSLVLTHPSRRAGLYFIAAGGGARNFYYWRGESAAREMLRLPQSAATLTSALRARWCLLSGITLAILPPEDRALLLAAITKRKRATPSPPLKVAFDLNYRPACWANADEARAAVAEFFPAVDLLFGGDEDIAGLYNCGVADGLQHLPRTAEVVLRENRRGAYLRTRGKREARFMDLDFDNAPPDPTAAGDSFNAAYLFARESSPPTRAAMLAHDFARCVIHHRGAIVPVAATAKAQLMRRLADGIK